jgi:hypothetical protein
MSAEVAIPLIGLLTIVATALNALVAVVVLVLRNQVQKSATSMESVHSAVNGNLERLEKKLTEANEVILTANGQISALGAKVANLEELLKEKS